MDENALDKRSRGRGNAGRCSKKKSKNRYAKKRRFYGKKKTPVHVSPVAETDATNDNSSNNTDTHESIEEPSLNTSASNSKIVDISTLTTTQSTSLISGYRFIDAVILADVFQSLACPVCSSVETLQLSDINEKKMGLASYLQLKCASCLYTKAFYTSQQVNVPENKGGPKPCDINIRTVYACRQVGVGHKHLEKLCNYLNMPPPMTKNNYTKITQRLKLSAKHVAEDSHHFEKL